ncbi:MULTISPECIES: hypothetical protein [Stenotrophomonas]|jgi:hypothetical protein|nr:MULTISPECIES: hypothetical protein [Stenotrophomonas]MCX2893385.1 hypothetical protein [Stenotrophomonas lactitubi]
MKLQLASMAALMLAIGSMASAGSAVAGVPSPPGSTTECVPVEVERYRIHQHCTVTFVDETGSVFVSEYWIDEYGNPYLI